LPQQGRGGQGRGHYFHFYPKTKLALHGEFDENNKHEDNRSSAKDRPLCQMRVGEDVLFLHHSPHRQNERFDVEKEKRN
jgi:hypothetical protein